MTFCNMCGAQMNDNDGFCPACGAKAANASADNGYQPAENQFYDNTQVASDYAQYDQAQYDQYAYNQPAPVAVKKKKSKAPVIIIAVIALIAAVVGVLFATGTFDKLLKQAGIISSPANEIFNAAKKTIFESQSLTITATTEDDDEAVVQISFGNGIDEVKMYAEINGRGDYGIYDGVVYEYQEGTSTLDGTFVDKINGVSSMLEVGDADEMVNSIFDGKINEKAIKDIYNVSLRDGIERYMKILYLQGLSEEEMMKYVEVTETSYKFKYDEIPVNFDLPDYDSLMAAIDDFLMNGLTEEAITFEKDGDSYEFTINAAEFLDCLSDFIKENETMKSLVEVVYEMYDFVSDLEGNTGEDLDIHDELNSLADDCREEKIKYKGKVTIEDGYLTYLKIDIEGDPVEFRISKIGSTTVDKAKIDAIDTVDPYEDEYDYYDDYYNDDYYYDDYYNDDYYYDDYYNDDYYYDDYYDDYYYDDSYDYYY